MTSLRQFLSSSDTVVLPSKAKIVGTVFATYSSMSETLLSGIVRACMFCNPGLTAFNLIPNVPTDLGLTISHGCCKMCSDKWIRELATTKGEGLYEI